MFLKIPELSLVLLVGISGSGKSTFAKKFFKKTEIVSSDECRAMICDDETNQSVTQDAFAVLHCIASRRLKNGMLTIIDATNLKREFRKELVHIGSKYHVPSYAILLDVPKAICLDRNQNRSRVVDPSVILEQWELFQKSISELPIEGYKEIFRLQHSDLEILEGIIREKNPSDRKEDLGPFDIIGDVHGCIDELLILLEKLGYSIELGLDKENSFGYNVVHSNGRKVVFLGDLVDRGPDSPAVLKLAMSMVQSGVAYLVSGNHDFKLQKFLSGRNVKIGRGLEITVQQLEKETEEFKNTVLAFLQDLPCHILLDHGNLVVAHAGLKEEMQGRNSEAVRSFCLYGETNGEIDEFGLPVRINWARDYRGKAKVVYGHTPVPLAVWHNNTIDIDTGCVFGGQLTALRYPEMELVSVNAKKKYFEPRKPFEKSMA